jgi:hypothetical protein
MNAQPRTTRASIEQRSRSSRTAALGAAARNRESESASVSSMTAFLVSMAASSQYYDRARGCVWGRPKTV